MQQNERKPLFSVSLAGHWIAGLESPLAPRAHGGLLEGAIGDCGWAQRLNAMRAPAAQLIRWDDLVDGVPCLAPPPTNQPGRPGATGSLHLSGPGSRCSTHKQVVMLSQPRGRTCRPFGLMWASTNVDRGLLRMHFVIGPQICVCGSRWRGRWRHGRDEAAG